ncbi:MAG: T9SS type A sorting domain-containing protein [Bacteroidetes bacterium]|nr:T9SS type A sorting domain-containing protein [Bacteroidota bacterium]
MKKQITFIIGAVLLFAYQSFSQIDVKTIDMAKVNQAKIDGKMNGTEKYVNYDALGKNPARIARNVTIPNSVNTASGCACWIPRDSSWQVAQFDGSGGSGGPGLPPDYRNDDWSTVQITVPFPFCFYGQQVNFMYINNNGNVSINNPYATFTANSFPDPTYTMIAPFWGDVDTRGALSGIVYYQLTNTHLIVQWENVGYFSSHDDLANTFQLIMTDGFDPLLPPGSNVSFCYQDMQWTTGDASGGTGGFGGTPATVGVNNGNGIDYIQIGLFDQTGNSYDGPFANNDGIDALDNQSFIFNVCQSGSNVPPILNSNQACDTLTVCEGDTLLIEGSFLSPEQGQITTVTTSTTMSGVTVTSLPGNTSTFTVQVIVQASNIGLNQLMVIAADDGTPAQASQLPVVINVVPGAVTQIATTNVSCHGGHNGSVNMNVSGTGPFDILWMPGERQTPNLTHLTAGTYSVNVISPTGCSSYQYITITEPPALALTITSQNADCSGQPGSAVCTVAGGTAPYSYSWNTTPPQNTNSITNLSAGTYIVTVTDNNNCHSSGSVEITSSVGFTATMSTTPATCQASDGTASIQITGGSGNFSYSWIPSVSTSATATGLNAGVYSVTVTDNVDGCQQTLTGTVSNTAGIVASIVSSTNATCQNSEDGTATAIGSGGTLPYSYLWMPGGATTASVTNLSPGTYTVEVSDYVGCPDYATVTISYQFASPVIDLGPDTTICVGASLTLDAGSGYQYLWSDNSTNQVLTVTSDGTYSVLITDGNGCEAFDAITVTTITCNPIRSSSSPIRNVGIYPNPSTGMIDINFGNETAGSVEINVIDAYGKTQFVSQESLKAYDTRKLNLKELASGIYFVRISFGNDSQTIRMIKME